MRDYVRLRNHLRAALLVAPLLGGCTHAPSLPSCPSGKWCGSATEVKPLARADATEQLGCASTLSPKEGQEVPKNWPEPNLEMYLDEDATRARRAAHDDATCCYNWTQPCPGGRALVVDGRAMRAAPRWGRALAGDTPAQSLDPDLSALLAGV